MEKVWRLIDSGPCSAFFNMALDEAIAVSVRKKGLPPTLRFFGWDRSSVSIGRFQRISDIDLAYCSEKDIPVVRRPTGGRAILHGNEITYSFSAGTLEGPFSKGLLDSYRRISDVFTRAFGMTGVTAEAMGERERGNTSVGSPLCFHSSSFGEILIQGEKVVGSAQKRWDDGLLQQGSIPFSRDEADMNSVFRIFRGQWPADSCGAVSAMPPQLGHDSVKQAIIRSFGEVFGVSLQTGYPSRDEQSLALELERLKYRQSRWNLLR